MIGNTDVNVANAGSNIVTIQASIFALQGGVTGADNQNRKRQRLEIYGSITQGVRKGVGSGGNAIGAATGDHEGLPVRSAPAPHARAGNARTPLMTLDSYFIKSGRRSPI